MTILIRPVDEKDGHAIQDVARKSWNYTYAKIFTPEFINDFVNRAYNPIHMPAYLQQMEEQSGHFVVASSNDSIIGFAQINKDWDFEGEYRISRIYLLPEYIGQGIGKRLIESCESFLIDINQTKYGLYVHRDNEIGMKFYMKSGFKRFHERDDEDELYLTKTIKQ